MPNQKMPDIFKTKSREVDLIFKEVAILRQLIKERVHPLDLVRELLSNAGAKEVKAAKIEISYTKDKEGHIFEILDDGCGMNFTGKVDIPGRLDKFLGLGLSGIIGVPSDEFSWKGLGSKLSFHSRRVEIETCCGGQNPLYIVRINEPWQSIENNNVPRPKISEYPAEKLGTKIRVIGHPPHRLDKPFTFIEIKNFLQHRTFAGFTKKRDEKPEIILSVLGQIENIGFGLPEFDDIDFDNFAHQGLKLSSDSRTLFINMLPKSSKSMRVQVKGLVTWDPRKYELSSSTFNTGLILSVKGIPYFNLNLEEYGATSIRTARPGEKNICMVVECDAIQDEMNISRSGLVDSAKSIELKQIVSEIFQRIESSPEYLEFRTMPEKGKREKQSDIILRDKRAIERKEQNWVIYERHGITPRVLIREPKNEQEVNALIWKLEALEALPFERFRTLAYIGAAKGPDLLVNFQEEKGSEPQPATVIEIENNFYNFSTHGHAPNQYPKVICWDIPSQGRKVKINKTDKPYKFTINFADFQVHIFVLKLIDGIKVLSREELENEGIAF
jgi:hypothetical protein